MSILEILIQKLEGEKLWKVQRELSRNDFLVNEGDKDSNIYFIVDGTFRIFIQDGEVEHTTRFAYSGDLIAALDTFITGNPTTLNIQSLKKAWVKIVTREAFMTFIESDPDIKHLWIRIMEQLIYTQMEREHDILITSPAERYRRVLQRSPRLFQEIPHKYIASYLRMTPETLSRLKKY